MIEVGVPILVVTLAATVLAAVLLRLRIRHRVPWLTLVAIGLLGVAAVGVRIPAEEPGRSVVLLDVSWSMGGEIPTVPPVEGRAAEYVVFGRRAVPIRAAPDVTAEVRAAADESATELAAALRTLASSTRPGDAVTIVTDGRGPTSGLREAAATVRAAGALIRVVSGGRPREGDARVTSLRAPGRVPAKSGVTVLATVAGRPGSSLPVRLIVDGEERERREVGLGVSGAAGLRFDVESLGSGRHEIQVAVVPPTDDPCAANDRRSTGLVSEGARRAALVNAPGLRSRLDAAGWSVTEGVPAELAGLDLLVVRDAPITVFDDRGEAVRRYVESGGGLLVAGGTRCFGPGGWGGTPLEECLPVRSHPAGEGLFVAVLLDRSGTMGDPFREGSTPKFDAAKRATDALVSVLPDGTRLLLVPFAGEVLGAAKVLELTGPASKSNALGRLDGVGLPSGGTSLVAPLARARKALADVTAQKRLVLLFTDGHREGESAADVSAAAAALRGAGARLVCFAVGEDADRELLDELGGPGRKAVPVTADGEVRDGFLEALFELQGEDRILPGEHSVAATGQTGLPVVDVGPVKDLVRTWPRPGATTWHETPGDVPVTAGRRYGLGQSVVVAADLSGLPGALATALVEAAARPAALGSARIEVGHDGGQPLVSAALELDAAAVFGRVTDSAGRSQEVTLTATGPGTFGATLADLAPGAAWFDLAAVDGPPVRAGASVPWPPEYASSGPDEAALDDLRKALGGDPGGRPLSSRDVSPLLAGLALLLFLADRLKRRGPAVR